MAADAAPLFGFREVRCVVLAGKNHVACLEGDGGVGMRGGVVGELADFLHGIVDWGSLLHCEGSKGCEHGHVVGAVVVEEDA